MPPAAVAGTRGPAWSVPLEVSDSLRADFEIKPAEPRGNAAQIALAARVYDICEFSKPRRKVAEPSLDDITDVVGYARVQYQLSGTLDPNKKVFVGEVEGKRKSVELPVEVKEAASTAQRQLTLFFTRVSIAEAGAKDGSLDGGEVRALVDDAFLRLVSGPYTSADRRLSGFVLKVCPS